MSRLAGLALTVCMCASLVLGGCGTQPTREEWVSFTLTKADALLTTGDLSNAYQTLVPLLNASIKDDAQKAIKYIQSHPELISAGEAYLLKSATSFAQGVGKYGASESIYLSWLFTDLEAFHIAAPSRYESVLATIKDLYRQYGPLEIKSGLLHTGMSRSDVLKVIGRPPQLETVIRPLGESADDLVVMEYVTSITTSKGEKNMSPLWLAFYKGELMSSGDGGAKEAEYSIYEDLMFTLARAKKIKYLEGAHALATKHRALFGEASAEAQEYWSYQAVLAEKIDNNKITEIEAQYLMTQKVNELRKRIKDAEEERGLRARAEVEATRSARAVANAEEMARQSRVNQSLLMMGMGLQLMQQARPVYQPTMPVTCRTVRQGTILSTTCQ